MRWRSTVNFELSLATDFIDRGLIGQLTDELISLNVDVLLAWGRLWCLNVTCEELFGSLGPLLFESLGIVLSLVSLEKLIWVCSCWNDHSRICASTEDTFVVSNVLRVVLLFLCSTIRILILLFLRDYAGMGSKALSSSSFL